jgi:hypothetical protein
LVDKHVFNDLLPCRKAKQPYIASFILDRTKETAAIESYISRHSGSSIYSLNKREVSFWRHEWTKFLSVKEWLVSIRDSEMIITDSFHCVCFSLIFQKKFVCIGNKTRGLARLNSLLKIVGLENRIILDSEQLIKSNILNDNINYDDINKCLIHQRNISIEFLKQALVE